MLMTNKKILIAFLLVIELIMVNLTYQSFLNKEINKEENKIEKKQFAMFIKEDNEYVEYKGNSLFPKDYYVNKDLSKCVDENGNTVDNALNSMGSSVTITSSKTIYCTLYFDKNVSLEYLRSKDTNNYLTKEVTGGMYRYQGTDNVPNWICFGTRDQELCKSEYDKYMYRIIGINENGELYLLKETFLKEGEVMGFAWNDEYKISGEDADLCPDGICPEWNEADLFQRINGIANGSTPGNGNANDGKDDDTDIFVDSEYYDYLKSGDKINGGEEASIWYNIIDTHSWYYGDSANLGVVYKGDTIYEIETGKIEVNHYVKGNDGIVISQNYTWTNKVDAKISLMYLHDYAYAYPEGNSSVANGLNSWIHFRKDGYNSSTSNEWFSTRWGIHSVDNSDVLAYRISYEGPIYGGNGSWNFLGNGNSIRPVFYLTNAITLNGNGTKIEPFTINISSE